MEKIKYQPLLFVFFLVTIAKAQHVEIIGKVTVAADDIEGIHVINKTANRFTITQNDGSFRIPAKLKDTLIFSAIKYKPKEVIVDAMALRSKTIQVFLTELVNELNEVVVGKVLTGNLMSDVENSESKRAIDFYDLGIPGYTGKPLTISENTLHEAGEFKPIMLLGLLMGSVPLNPILNGISGRTKQLKNQVKIERSQACMNSIVSNLSETFFAFNDLDASKRTEFFYYCAEDDDFLALCKIKNDIQTLEFLSSKLKIFKENLIVETD